MNTFAIFSHLYIENESCVTTADIASINTRIKTFTLYCCIVMIKSVEFQFVIFAIILFIY